MEKQQGGKHFGVRMNDEVRGWEKQKATLPPLDDKCFAASRRPRVLLISLSPALSRPILQRLRRVRRALRALMMQISRSVGPFHLRRVIKIHEDILVSNA